MNAKLQEYLERAVNGENLYISNLRNLFERSDDTIIVQLLLSSSDTTGQRRFPINIPLPETLDSGGMNLVRDYLCASVYNLISSYGGRALTFHFDSGITGLSDLLVAVRNAFDVEESKGNRSGYGRCLNVAERMNDALDKRTPGSSRFVMDFADSDSVPTNLIGEKPHVNTHVGMSSSLNRLPNMLRNQTVLGMDIGGSDIKVVLAMNGKIVAYKEYDWFPANFKVSRQLIDPVLLIARWANMRACAERGVISDYFREKLDLVSTASASDQEVLSAVVAAESSFSLAQPILDAIGLCFPDVVVKDKIVGGEVYKTRGIRNNPSIDYEVDYSQLTDLNNLLSAYCRYPDRVSIINDGPMAAFTAAVEMSAGGWDIVNNGVFAHTLGTELGTGWIDSQGHIPELPLEVYNYIIDLGSYGERCFESDDPRSINNFNTGLPGTLQKYISQSGVFRLALKQFPKMRPDLYKELFEKGFLVQDPQSSAILINDQPRDMRKPLLEHLMSLVDRESEETCLEIFRKIGEYLAVTWLETEAILATGSSYRILFGRLVKSATCFLLMCEGAARIAPEMTLVVADDDSANTELMMQLKEDGRYTVAQFAQAVGAVYFAIHQKEVPDGQ